MIRKGLVIVIIFLFVGASIVSGITINQMESVQQSSRGTLYVGGNGSGNYTKIQDAIDNASDGDTVFVYDDSSPYYENIIIDKSINLIGENKESTIINGSGVGSVAYVIANWVNITGFNIQNSGNSWQYGGIKSVSKFNCFSYNKISYNLLGIYYPKGSSNNTLTGNTISTNEWGIAIDKSSNNTISDNCISNNDAGLYLSESNNNSIVCNNISNNKNYGFYLDCHNYNNYIAGNNICSSNNEGIYFVWDSNNYNYIVGNNISNNEKGIYLYFFHNNNKIMDNTISNNDYGIVLRYYCCNNTIKGNTISDNGYGINLRDLCNNNLFYHNNLINNSINAYDECSNIWDNSYPSGGNYWSDYTGEDNNYDGIGDTSYDIPGGYNQDLYPLMYLFGENLPVGNFTYSVNETPVLFNGSSSYDRDGEIVSFEWDFGDGTTGNGETIYHKYCANGTYEVTLTVTDDDGYKGDITKTIEVDEVFNQPPKTPIINGPTTGKPGQVYSYVFVSEDLDGDDVFYEILWGDGTFEEWIGPYGSGELVVVNHSWSKTGTYTIMARVRDFCNATSDWGELEVTMPRDKATNNLLLLRLLERFPILQKLLQQLRFGL